MRDFHEYEVQFSSSSDNNLSIFSVLFGLSEIESTLDHYMGAEEEQLHINNTPDAIIENQVASKDFVSHKIEVQHQDEDIEEDGDLHPDVLGIDIVGTEIAVHEDKKS